MFRWYNISPSALFNHDHLLTLSMRLTWSVLHAFSQHWAWCWSVRSCVGVVVVVRHVRLQVFLRVFIQCLSHSYPPRPRSCVFCIDLEKSCSSCLSLHPLAMITSCCHGTYRLPILPHYRLFAQVSPMELVFPGRRRVLVSSVVRTSAAEQALFEGDDEGRSLATLVLDCLRRFVCVGEPVTQGGVPGRGYSFSSCLSYLAIDRASLSRRSTTPTPIIDISKISAHVTFFPIHNRRNFCVVVSFCSPSVAAISQDSD